MPKLYRVTATFELLVYAPDGDLAPHEAETFIDEAIQIGDEPHLVVYQLRGMAALPDGWSLDTGVFHNDPPNRITAGEAGQLAGVELVPIGGGSCDG